MTTPDADTYEPVVQGIKIGIAIFSALLLGLSLSYKKTAIKSTLYAAIAYGLFAAQLVFDYLADVVPSLDQPYNDVIFYAMTLAILLLFFTAISRAEIRDNMVLKIHLPLLVWVEPLSV